MLGAAVLLDLNRAELDLLARVRMINRPPWVAVHPLDLPVLCLKISDDLGEVIVPQLNLEKVEDMWADSVEQLPE